MSRRKRGTKSQRLSIISTAVFISVMVVIAVVYYYVSPGLFKSKNLDGDTNSAQTIKSDIVTGDLVVHFVDVWQGDGIIIQLPDGKNMLIDAGFDIKKNKILDYIDALGITKFDYLIATHPDQDHIGIMPKIFDKYEISYVYRPHVLSTYKATENGKEALPADFNLGKSGSYACDTLTYYNFLRSVVKEEADWSFFNKDSDVTFVYTSESTEYSCSFDFLTPAASVKDIAYNKSNNYSPIIRIEYCGYKMLLTGDAEFAAENEMLGEYESDLGYLDVDLLKVGHHGSSLTSTGAEFLAAVKPEVSVISCGKGNDYKHPNKETLNNLVGAGSAIYRTDVQGSIKLTVSKDGTQRIETSVTDYDESALYLAPD